MDALPGRVDRHPAPFEIVGPAVSDLPIVLASPHSGRAYDAEFLRSSALDGTAIRRSEDSFVDELLLPCAGIGIPLLSASFPRAYCDVNRERWELDPAMFADPLPEYCNTTSPRVRAGFGTIPRSVASGQDIYAGKLRFAEAEARIHRLWDPYHAALGALIHATVERLGRCLLLDFHSMPSDAARAGDQADFVLGDRHGSACDPFLVRAVEAHLAGRGHSVVRNDPYAGGFVTRHYGRPGRRVHVLQVEISRALYMDERTFERGPGFDALRATLAATLRAVIEAMTA